VLTDAWTIVNTVGVLGMLRAATLRATLGEGKAPGAPTELMLFHLLQAETDAAADWAEKAIAQRDPYFVVLMATLVGAALRVSPRWTQIAGAMNLPAGR
jgi:hypothetical protein